MLILLSLNIFFVKSHISNKQFFSNYINKKVRQEVLCPNTGLEKKET